MTSNPVPQLVNVTHALPTSTIQEMRSNLDIFEQQQELNDKQKVQLRTYLTYLENALVEFGNDNKNVKIGENGVTQSDIDLVVGLLSLYKDYLNKFIQIKNVKDPEIDNNKSATSSPNINLEEGVQSMKEQGKTKRKQSTATKKKKEIYIAESSKNGSIIEQKSEQSELNPEEELTSKKKISFSKYLKKDDSMQPNVDNKRSLPDDESTEVSSATSSDSSSNKKAKLNDNSSKIRSILKNRESNTDIKKSRKKMSIKFHDESDLVRVYGDDLPNNGLKVTPVELKKILRPFKEGEPNERLLIEGFSFKPKLLNIQITVQDSDISDTKNGPIPCDSRTPLLYRDNFRNFSKDLKLIPREPIPEANTNQDKSGPLLVKAFGRNGLLLRKDRGGIPYKRVPEVRRNEYPVKYSG